VLSLHPTKTTAAPVPTRVTNVRRDKALVARVPTAASTIFLLKVWRNDLDNEVGKEAASTDD
jgi:hypothetical protein